MYIHIPSARLGFLPSTVWFGIADANDEGSWLAVFQTSYKHLGNL